MRDPSWLDPQNLEVESGLMEQAMISCQLHSVSHRQQPLPGRSLWVHTVLACVYLFQEQVQVNSGQINKYLLSKFLLLAQHCSVYLRDTRKH